MSKIFTIIEREYSTRVKKKSFIIMSILGPVFFAALMIGPAWFSQVEDTEVKLIAVSDSSHIFYQQFPETKYIKFEYLPDANIEKYKADFQQTNYYAILYITQSVANSTNSVFLFSDRSPGMGLRMHISNTIEKKLESEKLKAQGVDPDILKSVKTSVTINSVKLSKGGEIKEENFTLKMVLGYIMGFLMYFTIFFAGSQVMRGVIEEKTNRIIEVIVSSVKPIQLMMGKIIGVGLVALTQFALWIVLTIGITYAITPILMPDTAKLQPKQKVETLISTNGSTLQQEQPSNDELGKEIKSMFNSLGNINFAVIIFSFIFFFFGGYFLYGAMFAAVGSAVDNESDTQQFVMPITMPLILAIVIMMNAVQNPESTLTYWFSMIPFTSPVIMMARIPHGVPYSQIFLSAFLLIVTFVAITWLAGKIYRTGILMYGKKSSWGEMWKWMRY